MKKLHQNIFYYYKGIIDKDVERQLEDNTTKALVNVLENSSLATQNKIIQGVTGIKIPKDVDKINYILQVSTIGKERIADISNRFLLAISPLGKIEDYDVEYERNSRPDAWIWSSDFVILFENKTRGELNKAQLKQHNKLLNGKTIIRSWINDVYPVIKEIASNAESEKDKFLLTEFRKYLEMIELSGFEGFEKEDFMRLYCDDEDREEFDYLKSKFDKLAVAMGNKIGRKGLLFRQASSDFSKRDLGWYGFYTKYTGPRGKEYKCEEIAHFSVFLADDAFNVKLHVVGPHLKNLRNKLKDNEQKKQFISVLNNLKGSDEAYEITVSESVPTGTPYETDWSCEYTVYSEYISDDRLKTAIQMILDETTKKWFNIYCSFDPKEAEQAGKNIVKDIEKIIGELWEIYSFIIE